MSLLEAIAPELPAVIAITGFGGKSTILDQLAAEARTLDLAEEALRLLEVSLGQPLPDETTVVLWVAGLDVLDGAPAPSGWEGPLQPAELASQLRQQHLAQRTVYVLNKTDDELRLQQARQVAALLVPATTVATVDGQLVWPNDEDRDELGR